MNYLVAGSTDIGTVKATNQDSFLVKVINYKDGKMVFAIICDGVGGLSEGEVASGTIVNAFNRWTIERLPFICEEEITDSVIRKEWTEVLNTYNQKILSYGKSKGIQIGTTTTAMLITASRYYIINIGDTRAYELKNSLRVLTKDQTLVAREVELGNLTPEEAKTDSRRNILLQCVGISQDVSPDMYFGDTMCNAVYMLCSDGFRHVISEDEILSELNPNNMTEENNMKSRIDGLIELNKYRQERDNITVITIKTF